VLLLENILTKGKNSYLRDEVAVLDELPSDFKNSIMISIRKEFDKKIELFVNISQEMFEYLFNRLK